MSRALFLKNLWRWAAGVPEIDTGPCSYSEDLWRTEWSPRFEAAMRARLVMGALRYGRLHSEGKAQYDYVGAIESRLKVYRKTGNIEILVDIADLALLEFEDGRHPKRHYRALDDNAETGRVELLVHAEKP